MEENSLIDVLKYMSKTYRTVSTKYIHDESIIHYGNHHHKQTLNEIVEAHACMLSIACYGHNLSMNDYEYSSGDYISFNNKVFDTTPNYFTMQSNGLFITNYTGYVKLSLNLWLYSGVNDYRPWVQIQRYSSGTPVGHAITSAYNNYQSAYFSDLVFSCTTGESFGVRVYTNNDRKFRVNAGSGMTNASCITLQRV